MARTVSSVRLSSVHVSVPADFYRQEFIKHRNASRDSVSTSRSWPSTGRSGAGPSAERLEQLCSCDNADQLMASLLRQFNAVTGLSAWTDPKQLH